MDAKFAACSGLFWRFSFNVDPKNQEASAGEGVQGPLHFCRVKPLQFGGFFSDGEESEFPRHDLQLVTKLLSKSSISGRVFFFFFFAPSYKGFGDTST